MKMYQIPLITLLIVSLAFIACDRSQPALEPVMTDDMLLELDVTVYNSWAHVMLGVPVAEAAATGPSETGAVHGMGSRTVYINAVGALANEAGTPYPAGTQIVKEIMDDTNTFIQKVAMMTKSDDPMYAGHNGWIYKKYARPDEASGYTQVKGVGLEDAGQGCHGCHSQADNDSVFVSLSVDAIVEATTAQ